MVVMWAIGGTLIYLAIKKDMEPSLLLPMGFGAILVNLPLSGAIDQMHELGIEVGALSELFRAGISNELFPLLLFIGIGAMIDFGPLLANPKLLLFGAAAQFGIFMTLTLACLVNLIFPGMFSIQDAASVAIIGAADGPTSIFVGNFYGTKYLGAIIVAAYSYMALVPIIQPPVIRMVTTKKERLIRMPYEAKEISKTVRILFPIVVTVIAGLIAPRSVSLVGFLMFGNLLRECAGKPHYHRARHHRCHPDAGGYVPVLGHADDHAAWSVCIYFRHGRRRDVCQVPQSVHEEKNQSDDRRMRHFRVSDEQPCGP